MKATKKKGKESQDSAPVSNQFERFEVVEVHRSQLKDAPYNPRILSPKARKKLKANIERVGLLTPPVWNEKTGHIVGGHQRVSILDSLHKTSNYTLKVAKVQLEEQVEREQNLFLNNYEAQGDWDMEKLEELFKEGQVNPENAGFDLGDIYRYFGDNPITYTPDEVDELREKREQMQKSIKINREKREAEENTKFYLIFIFKDAATRSEFTKQAGMDDVEWQDGRELFELLEKKEEE